MTKKIYVGNLPFSATIESVTKLFETYGTIGDDSISMINDRETGRFRGFCFVEMEDEGASKAIEALDGQDFEGRPLRVNEARPQEKRRNNYGSGGGGGGYGGGGGGGGYGGGGGGRDRNRDRY